MSNTRRFIQLDRRINEIESNYLPITRPLGNYTKVENDNLRAYILLIHAEFEAYFEEIGEDKAKKAFAKWKANRTKSNVLLSLASFHEGTIKEFDIEKRINKALSNYINNLRHNHGIKEDNILSILLPIGLEHNDIDTTWLNTISSFGTNRGEIAHTSAKVQSPLDPPTLKNTINQILSEIRIIDEKLRKIK